MLSFKDLENRIVEHARKVLEEANELKKSMISPIALSTIYKRKWEAEVRSTVSEFIGEKVTLLGKDSGLIKGEGDWICICDLLDGSKNFLADTKFYAYSLALARKGEISYSIVIDLDKMWIYRAEKGRGSTLNGKDLKKIASNRSYRYEIITSNVTIPSPESITMKCSSLELCALAQGSAWVALGDTWNIDIAAGYLITLESGNIFVDWNFKPLNLPVNSYSRIMYIAGSEKSLAEFIKKYRSELNSLKSKLT